MSELMKTEAATIAKQAMKNGKNCCEAVLSAADEVWSLKLAPDTMASAKFFHLGMESGCTCGALAGMVLAAGILTVRHGSDVDKNLAKKLRQRFLQDYQVSCCRVIRSNFSFGQRIANRGCIELTGKAAAWLVEIWEDSAHERDNGYNSNPK